MKLNWSTLSQHLTAALGFFLEEGNLFFVSHSYLHIMSIISFLCLLGSSLLPQINHTSTQIYIRKSFLLLDLHAKSMKFFEVNIAKI